MSDLVSNLLMNYGSAAVIAVVIGAVIVALVIWGLAHFAAAPGTPVKVFWGLVDYTKRLTEASGDLKAPTVASSDLKKPTVASDDLKKPTVASGDLKAPTEASGDPKPANSQPSLGLKKLDDFHGLTPEDYEDPDDYEEMKKELRSRHGLRKLRPFESDKPIQASPPGTYFFIHCSRLKKRSDPVSGKTLLDSPPARWSGDSWGYFEVHHRGTGEWGTDEFLLLAFLRETDAGRVRALTGDREIEISIAPRPRETFSTLVELPLERIVAFGNLSLPFVQFIEKKIILMVPNVTVR